MGNGIHHKYEVKRTDGSSAPGGKHERCAYFVLDLEHDRFAIPALIAYATAARETHPSLSADIMTIVSAQADKDASRCSCREAGCPHALWRALTQGASDAALKLMSKAGKP